MALGYMIIRSPYNPYSIYSRGTPQSWQRGPEDVVGIKGSKLGGCILGHQEIELGV